MDLNTMTVELRDASGKGVARKLRASGRVPGVLYGQGQPSKRVHLDRHTFQGLMRAGAHHGLFEVSLGGGGEKVKALVREIQIHPVTREVLHIDLQEVSMEKEIRVVVLIHLTGKPEGVRNQGGILEHHLREIEIECLPSEIPHEIEVDVTDLQVGQSIHISDLARPGIKFLGHGETTVTTVSLPAAERSVEEAAAEAAAAGAAEAAAPAEGEAKAEKEEKA